MTSRGNRWSAAAAPAGVRQGHTPCSVGGCAATGVASVASTVDAERMFEACREREQY
jgi:hypothetical protein